MPPDRLAGEARTGISGDGFPLAAPGLFAPALSFTLIAGKAASSFRFPKINWGKPVHHAAIAAVSSGHVAALWWSLFLYGGHDGASALAILLSSMIPGMMIGGHLASLIHDAIQAPVLEAGVKPKLAQASKILGTAELTPSLMGSQGMADYEYNRRMYQMLAMEHELNLHHNLEERRSLREAARTGPLSPAESDLLAKYDKAVATSIGSLDREQDHLAAVGLSLPETLLAIVERERGSRSEAETQKRAQEQNAVGKGVSALWGTFLATSALTAGAMLVGYGMPQWTDNTQDLFAFFGVSALFGTFFGYIYQRTIQENVYYYLIRPLESRINRWGKSIFGRDIFPIAAGMLGIPDSERYKTMFERAKNNCSNQALRLEGRAVRLKTPGNLQQEELERLGYWEDVLERWNGLDAAIKTDLDKING